jgi:hypothetical protein
VSKKFGEWYQTRNKTEDKNKLTLLAFKIIAILHNTLLATWKLSAKASLGIDRRTAVTRSWIAAKSAKPAPFMMLFRRGNRKKSPDLAPSDFFLFPRLKSIMKGARFGGNPRMCDSGSAINS